MTADDSAIGRAKRQRERVMRWAGEARPVPAPATALDRHVNRADELVKEDGTARYVFYAPDASGLIYISKAPPPAAVRAFVLVDGKEYPRIVRR